MLESVLLLLGLFVGVIVGWLIAARRAAVQAAQLADFSARCAAADARLADLQSQSAERAAALDRLRNELDRAQQLRVAAETRLAEVLRSGEEQRRVMEQLESRFKDAFAALSRETLKTTSDEFVGLAAQRIEPLREAITRFETLVRTVEESRQKDHGGMTQQLAGMSELEKKLAQETANLVTALRAPQVKGRWGELTLQRAVEAAGMSEHCDFSTQHSLDSEVGRLRPDMLIHLPGGRTIVVDAKAPTSAYLDAVAAATDDARREHLARHAAAVRAHMKRLSDKAYWSQFQQSPDFAFTPDFVVLFLPGEAFFSAALELDRTLIEDGLASRVIFASPTTLIAMLRGIAQSWLQHKQIENSRQILDAARQLFDRVQKFSEHYAKVGDALHRATDSYNAAASSFESRVLPAGRRLVDLGAADGEPAIPEYIDVAPRELSVEFAARRTLGCTGDTPSNSESQSVESNVTREKSA